MTTAPGSHPPSVTTQPRPLSPSRAADYKSCPLKYRYRTIDRIQEPPSAAATRGTLVHAAMERLFSLPAADRTPQAATGAIGQLWRELVARRPELATLIAHDELADWLTSAHQLIDRYFTLEDPRRFEPDACELRVEVGLPAGVPTRGVIDRVDVSPDGLLRIVDYKTGRSPAPAYTADALFQLKFYALMLFRLRGVVAARLRLIYLGDGQIVEYTPDEHSLLAFESTVITLWESIAKSTATGSFPPRRSKLCDWCSFQHICPEFGGTPPPYPLGNAADH